MLLEIFKAFLLTSAVGSVLTIILLLLKPFTKRLFGSAWQYYAWLTVLIVMILPVTIHLPQDNATLTPNVLPKTERIFTETAIQTEIEKTSQIQIAEVEKAQNATNVLSNISIGITDIISYIWLLGLISILGLNILRYLIFLRTIHKNSAVVSYSEIGTDKITVKKTNSIEMPLMVGVFRPMLLIPNMEISTENLNCIFLHELTHYKRHDLLYKWFAMIVNTVHWFNPFVYIVSNQIDKECEISCDLSVTKNMNRSEQKGYMNTILSLVSQSRLNSKLLTTSMANNKKQIEERFTMIKNATKKSKIIILISVITAISILAVSVFASGVLSDKNKSQILDKPIENQINILLIGADANQSADTLVLLSINKTDKRLTTLSIPRDTLIEADGQNAKIGQLMVGGNEEKIIDAVRNTLLLPVNYYAKINFEGFRNIVDVLGGVEFDLPMDMQYSDPYQDLHISLKKGLQLLDGDKAEQLVRYRAGYPDGDIARIGVQKDFIAELIRQKFKAEYFSNADQLYNEFSKNIVTNYPVERVFEDIEILKNISFENVTTLTLPGTAEQRERAFYYVADMNALEKLTQTYLPLK